MQHVNGTIPPPPQQIEFKVPELKQGAGEADVDAMLIQCERIELTLQGILPTMEGLAEKGISLAHTLHAYAKLMLAHITFVREVDGNAWKLTNEQRERLAEVEDGLDDVVDTLDWTLQGRDELKALVAEELGR